MNHALLSLGFLAIAGAAAGMIRVAPSAPRPNAEHISRPHAQNPDDAKFLALLDASGEGFGATFRPGQPSEAAKPTFMLVPHRVHRTLHNELIGVRPARLSSSDPLVDFMGILGPWPVLDGEGDPIPAYINDDGEPDPAGNPNVDAMAIGWYTNPIARISIRKSLLIIRGIRPTGGMELGAGEAMPGKDGDGDTPLFQGVSGKADGSTDTIVTLFVELLPPVKNDGGQVIGRSAILYVFAADTLGGHARIAFRGMQPDDISFDAAAWVEPLISSGTYDRPAQGVGYITAEKVEQTDRMESACFHFWPVSTGGAPVGQFVIVSWNQGASPPYSISAPAVWTSDTPRTNFVEYCKKLMSGAGIPTP